MKPKSLGIILHKSRDSERDTRGKKEKGYILDLYRDPAGKRQTTNDKQVLVLRNQRKAAEGAINPPSISLTLYSLLSFLRSGIGA